MEESSAQLWHEQELDKIRTEGDIALVRAQAERLQIAEADARLKQLQRQLKDKKKYFARLSVASGSGIVGDSATIEQLNHRQELARTQQEERLKATTSAKTTELYKLRHQIDEERRHRLDALQSEKSIVDETRRTEDTVKQSQAEMEVLKERASHLRAEIAHLQSDLDEEQNAFRLERQQLQLDLDRIARPEKVAVKVKVQGRKFTVFRSMAMTRKKRDALSRAKKLSLEQKVVSFEQKKVHMDRLVHESGVRSLNDFIHMYNQQEAEKAQILARVEAKSVANDSLKHVIAQFEEDITRLSGAGNIQSIVHTEQPNELKKKIDADNLLISQWTTEAQAFHEALKTFREPIRELHCDLFPQERVNDSFDTTTNEISMLRRIGAIEERVMQRVLMKILKETESSATQSSETLKRLQRYRGSLKRTENNAGSPEEVDGGSPVNTRASKTRLVVDIPSLMDLQLGNSADEEDDDDNLFCKKPMTAMRLEDYLPTLQSPI